MGSPAKSPEEPRSDHISLDRAPALVVKALSAFEEAVGGRARLVEVLAHYHQTSDDGELIMNLVADPGNAERSLASLCASAGLSVGKFLRIFASARGANAYLAAMERVWPRVPEVAAEVMRYAVTRKGRCTTCFGKGTLQGRVKRGAPVSEITCTACDGEGTFDIVPDLERQKVALQLAGLLRTSGAQVLIDQSKNQTAIVSPVAMRGFIAATNRVLYGGPLEAQPPEPVEAEVVGESMIDSEKEA